MLDAIRLAEVLVGHPQGGFIGQVIHHAVDVQPRCRRRFSSCGGHLLTRSGQSSPHPQKTVCLIQLLLQVLVTVHALAVSLVLIVLRHPPQSW